MSRMFKQLFSLTLAIMFLVCLMPVSASAAGYTAQLTFIDGWWAIQSYGAATTQINGGGTYTITLDLGDQTAQGTGQMSVLIPGAYSDLSSAGITVTSIKGGGEELLLDASKIAVTQVWADDGTGTWVGTEDLELKIYLNWESSTEGIIDITKVFTDSLEVTFVVGDYASSGDDETTAPEDETTEATDASDATDATGETVPEVEDASSGTTVFSGSQTVNENWSVGVEILTAIAGGSFDSSVLAEGGYFTVNYTGTSGQVYFATQDNVSWGWYSVNTPSSTVASGDGYVSTFTYADIVAAYGGAADLSDLGKLVVGTTEPGAPVTITRVAWHESAASDEEDPTDAPEASEPVGSSKELLKAPVTVGEGWQQVTQVFTTNWGGSFYAGQISKEDSFTVKLTGENLLSAHVVLQGTDNSWNQRDLEVTGMSVDADGNYVATFNCADYGMEKFSGIGAIYVYVNTDVGGSATVTSFTYNTDSPADGSNAATGDTFNFWLIPVMLVSAAALVVVIGKRKQFMA